MDVYNEIYVLHHAPAKTIQLIRFFETPIWGCEQISSKLWVERLRWHKERALVFHRPLGLLAAPKKRDPTGFVDAAGLGRSSRSPLVSERHEYGTTKDKYEIHIEMIRTFTGSYSN